MSYQETLLTILAVNSWDQLPKYPEHFLSLDEMKSSFEVKAYCLEVIKNLPLLVAVNTLVWFVEQKVLGGWENTWCDENNIPATFPTKELAEEELEDFLIDQKSAFLQGFMQDMYKKSDYRIVEKYKETA